MKGGEEILSHSDCPDDQTLQEYAYQRLSGAAMRKVELHLADCEMCNDMVEGMQSMKEPEFKADVKKLQDKVLNESRSRVIPLFGWKKMLSMAAAVALIFVIGGIFYNKMEEAIPGKMAMNKEGETDDEIIVQQESLSAGTAGTYVDTAHEKEKMLQKNPEGPVEDVNQDFAVAPTSVAENSPEPIARLSEDKFKAIPLTKENADANVFVGKNEDYNGVVTSDDVAAEKVVVVSGSTSTAGVSVPVAQEAVRLENDEQLVSVEISTKKRSGKKKSKSVEQPRSVSKKEASDKSKRLTESKQAKTSSAAPGGGYPKLHARVPLQFMKDGNYQSAFDFAKDLLQLEPENDTAQFIIGYSLVRLNKIEEGKKYLQLVADNANSPYDREAIFELALLKMKAGDESYKQTMKALSGGRDSTALKARGYR
jgi:hypothetical protein